MRPPLAAGFRRQWPLAGWLLRAVGRLEVMTQRGACVLARDPFPHCSPSHHRWRCRRHHYRGSSGGLRCWSGAGGSGSRRRRWVNGDGRRKASHSGEPGCWRRLGGPPFLLWAGGRLQP
ncbi:hypothetical protein I4F81_010927 [Pyropia yezoensis]|uniref:Uncharacterized protein n=1 Tax=Pyropia yezoensis TaxID=2788 RepID=A0ACC3CDZ7_PYRYE|nr:hypothetical protein I4F81_010927 [Neopyropia yezoensis]